MQENILGVVIKRERVKEKDIRIIILTASGLRRYNITGVERAQLFSVSEFTIAGHKIIKEYVMQSNHDITKNYNNYVRACDICKKLLDTIPFAGEDQDFPIALDELKQTIDDLERLCDV